MQLMLHPSPMLECLVIQQLMCTYYMSHVVCCIASVTRFSEEDGQQHESRRCTFIALMSGSEQRRSLHLTLRVRASVRLGQPRVHITSSLSRFHCHTWPACLTGRCAARVFLVEMVDKIVHLDPFCSLYLAVDSTRRRQCPAMVRRRTSALCCDERFDSVQPLVLHSDHIHTLQHVFVTALYIFSPWGCTGRNQGG